MDGAGGLLDPARELAERLRSRFGVEPCGVTFAPGRVNLIGEHTDYSGGLALATSVPLGITACVGPGPERVVVGSSAFTADASCAASGADPQGPFAAALVGVVRALEQAGVRVAGARLVLDTSLPLGMGLSSSAAFNVALIEALCLLAGQELEPEARIEVAREAEHLGTGVRCGSLDPAAIVHARAAEATLLDFRAGSVERVPVELGGAQWVVLDTGLPRALAETAYNQRRASCEAAEAALGARGPLAALAPADLPAALATLSPALHGIVRHVVLENARVRALAALLREPCPDRVAAGELLNASHRSLSVDYQVSTPAVDALLDEAREAGALGARIMGAGFGGACLLLWPAGSDPAAGLAPALARHQARTGRIARSLALGRGLGRPVSRARCR